jgi:acyl-CoA reductase-like NAD-dependent aldehyde dehydrogenase
MVFESRIRISEERRRRAVFYSKSAGVKLNGTGGLLHRTSPRAASDRRLLRRSLRASTAVGCTAVVANRRLPFTAHRIDQPRTSTMALASYARGEWIEGRGRTTALLHAVTGEPIAEASSEGLDFAGMLDYGRRVGGPALRRMTFHERALMLKRMAQHLMDRKEEFYALSAATGATRADSWIDIEGGISTFFVYSSKGRRELPDERFFVDGEPERISRNGTFTGRHICVPLEGVAVHINAFNFPCWGMLEKLAPALRRMTYQERALLLKRMAQHLLDRKEEF